MCWLSSVKLLVDIDTMSFLRLFSFSHDYTVVRSSSHRNNHFSHIFLSASCPMGCVSLFTSLTECSGRMRQAHHHVSFITSLNFHIYTDSSHQISCSSRTCCCSGF